MDETKVITVSEGEARLHKLNYDEFQVYQNQQKLQFQTSHQTIYYMVSTKYIQQFTHFCNSVSSQRELPDNMNEELIEDKNLLKVKKNLIQGQDFVLVSHTIYQLLLIKKISIFELKVKAYFQQNHKKFSFEFVDVPFISISPSLILKISKKQVTHLYLSIIFVKLSIHNTVSEYIQQFIKQTHLSPFLKIKVWYVNKKQNTTILNSIKQRYQKDLHSHYSIPNFGTQIINPKIPFKSLKITEEHTFLIECVEKNRLWIFYKDSKRQCYNCFQYFDSLAYRCGCNKIFFCSTGCQSKKIRIHKQSCQFKSIPIQNEKQIKIQKIKKELQNHSSLLKKNGKIGLKNLGNTCYMNSCLQCLSNTTQLTNYMLFYFQTELQGIQWKKLSNEYRKLLVKIWIDGKGQFEPFELKKKVQSYHPSFSGFEQQDSQEFYTVLLQNMRNQLNRGFNYEKENDESGNDFKGWYTSKKQSIIDELFIGQYKSIVTCEQCEFQSHNFELYNNITLEIPDLKAKKLTYYIIFNNHQKRNLKATLDYANINSKEWLKTATSSLSRNQDQFEFYILTKKQDIYKMSDLTCEQIGQLLLKGKTVFLLQINAQEKMIQDKLTFVTQFCVQDQKPNKGVLFLKRPFSFEFSEVDGAEIYTRILTYLYYSAFCQNKSKDLQRYIDEMIFQKPFILYLKWNKKKIKNETVFESYKIIQESPMISSMFEKLKIKSMNNDYELQVRFFNEGMGSFNFTEINNFVEEKDKGKNKAMKKNEISLQICIDSLKQIEKLEKSNKWYCPACKIKRDATKQISIYKVPPILVIHLKRFKSTFGNHLQKNQSNVIFPFELDLSKHVIDYQPMNKYIAKAKLEHHYEETLYPLQKQYEHKPIYELYAVNNHSGTLTYGHYTAYAKRNNKWFKYNDSYVSETSQKDIQSSQAYMLFYRRKQKTN